MRLPSAQARGPQSLSLAWPFRAPADAGTEFGYDLFADGAETGGCNFNGRYPATLSDWSNGIPFYPESN